MDHRDWAKSSEVIDILSGYIQELQGYAIGMLN